MFLPKVKVLTYVCILPPSCPLPAHSHIYFQVKKCLLYSINNITLNRVFWNFLLRYIRGYFYVNVYRYSAHFFQTHSTTLYDTTVIYLTTSLCWTVTMFPHFTIKSTLTLLHKWVTISLTYTRIGIVGCKDICTPDFEKY